MYGLYFACFVYSCFIVLNMRAAKIFYIHHALRVLRDMYLFRVLMHFAVYYLLCIQCVLCLGLYFVCFVFLWVFRLFCGFFNSMRFVCSCLRLKCCVFAYSTCFVCFGIHIHCVLHVLVFTAFLLRLCWYCWVFLWHSMYCAFWRVFNAFRVLMYSECVACFGVHLMFCLCLSVYSMFCARLCVQFCCLCFCGLCSMFLRVFNVFCLVVILCFVCVY